MTNDKPNNIIMRSFYGGQNVHTMFAGELYNNKFKRGGEGLGMRLSQLYTPVIQQTILYLLIK